MLIGQPFARKWVGGLPWTGNRVSTMTKKRGIPMTRRGFCWREAGDLVLTGSGSEET